MVLQPIADFTFIDAYPVTELSNNYQDLDNPASLLSSIASYEHTISGHEGSTTTSHDHFASLLQAATTATEAEAAQTGHSKNGVPIGQPVINDNFGFQNPPTGTKRKRSAENDYSSFIKTKHQRRSPGSEEDELGREREIWGPEENEDEESTMMEYKQSLAMTANARAIGVHSAAALFRRPSSASKKYTSKSRSPWSQIAAKLY